MNDLTKAAREDLTRLEPETWIEVWAERLLVELVARDEKLIAIKTFGVGVATLLGAAIGAMKIVANAITQFEQASGWKPGQRPVKATAKRWKDAQLMTIVTKRTLENFMRSSMPKIEAIRATIGTTTTPADSGQESARHDQRPSSSVDQPDPVN